MSTRRVVWTEGLFLRPQHFQQHDRYLESYVEGRVTGLRPHAWGFTSFELERELLGIGKVSLRSARGVFPDGTPFAMPDSDPVPAPLAVDSRSRDQTVYLAVPLRRAGADDVVRNPVDGGHFARYQLTEEEHRDTFTGIDSSASLEVASLASRLVTDEDGRDGYACIPVARILEVKSDGEVLLDNGFIPTVLRSGASERIATFIKEILGLLHQRGEGLGARVAAAGQGTAAEVADYLRLQIINRNEPVIRDIAASGAVHPEALYHQLIGLAGELATYTTGSRRPPQFPPYHHDDLRRCFEPAIQAVRSVVGDLTPQSAVSIEVKPRQAGIYAATVGESSLLRTARFIVGARASMPEEEMRRRFPSSTIVGPRVQDRFYQMVGDQIRGVAVSALTTVPREIPFNPGYAYFRFDQDSAFWQEIETAGGIAIYVPEHDFPDLQLELWAIRGQER